MKQIQKTRTQAGFTLIELVVVIVILGILAATALPKFVNLQTEARAASINAARGSVVSAMNLAHAQMLVAGTTSGSTVLIEGTTTATNYLGSTYPKAVEVTTTSGLAGLSADYSTTTSGSATTVYLAGASTTTFCSFVYTDTTTTLPPVIGQASTTGC